ncbi:Rho GTPase-activating protein 20, partial [Manis javanica]
MRGPLLLHDDVELRRGGRRQQRHLSLFSNALLVSNTEYSNLAKEDQPKSISMDIFTEDIKKCTSTLLECICLGEETTCRKKYIQPCNYYFEH